MRKKEVILENIILGKLVHGGQALAEAPNGKKLFVWGGLPGENVNVRITKKKSGYMEGIVDVVNYSSKDRIEPSEPLSYLSTSPWQIMTFSSENYAKQSILAETFEREGLNNIAFESFVASAAEEIKQPVDVINSQIPCDEKDTSFYHDVYHYRNKMELGFWGDENGLHLAHYVRGTKGKQIVEGSILASAAINESALKFIKALDAFAMKSDMRAGDLKTVVFRSSQEGKVVAALFIKRRVDMKVFKLPDGLQGLDIYYSDPNSPASVPTKKLYALGDVRLNDTVMNNSIAYDVHSFFQVNIPMFELALQEMKIAVGDMPSQDFYSGVGTIGIVIGSDTLVELDKSNVLMAKHNVQGTDTEVICASSESALKHITDDAVLIVDPPRAGLHNNVIEKILESKPPKIVYLSCNPSTQARDIKLLIESYNIAYARGYNFFPRTPHIESLIVLEVK